MSTLDELERLEKSATPGPWTYRVDDERLARPHPSLNDAHDDDITKNATGLTVDNGALIVAARNALPELIAASRERDRLRAALETIRSWGNNDGQNAIEMQMLAAEALFPGKFPTPAKLLAALKRTP